MEGPPLQPWGPRLALETWVVAASGLPRWGTGLVGQVAMGVTVGWGSSSCSWPCLAGTCLCHPLGKESATQNQAEADGSARDSSVPESLGKFNLHKCPVLDG